MAKGGSNFLPPNLPPVILLAMSTLAEIEAAVPRLSTKELERLEGQVKALRRERAAAHTPAQTNLAEFAGILRLTEDPLDWQRRMRGEWE